MNRIVFVLATFFLGAHGFADSVPLLKGAVALLRSKENPNHYIFVAKDVPANYSGGNYKVFETYGGGLKEHLLLRHSMTYFDGGSIDFYFDNGTRLWVTSGPDNYLDEAMETSLVYPDRPRELLEKLDVNEQSVRDAGFHSLLAPEAWTKTSRVEGKGDSVLLQNPEASEILLVRLAGKYSDRSAFEDLVDQKYRGPGYRRLQLNGLSFGEDTLFLTSAQVRKEIEILARQAGATRFEEFNVSPVIPVLQEGATAEEVNEFFEKTLLPILADIDGVFQAVRHYELKEAYGLGRQNEFSQYSENHPLTKRFLNPLRDTAKRLFLNVHEMGTLEASQFLLRYAHALNGAGVSLLTENKAHHVQSYLNDYLDWLLAGIHAPLEISDFSATDWEEWGHRRSSGGTIYSALGLSGETRGWTDHREGSPNRYLDFAELRSAIISILGRPAPPEAVLNRKKEIVQFVISADHVSNVLSERERKGDIITEIGYGSPFYIPPEIYREYLETGSVSDHSLAIARFYAENNAYQLIGKKNLIEVIATQRQAVIAKQRPLGNEILHRFINSLSYADEFRNDPDFNKALFITNAAGIFNELLMTSSVVIKNPATYLSLMNGAKTLMNDAEKAIVTGGPNGLLPSPELTLKISQLQKTFTKKLLDPLPYLDEHKAACAILLSPNPFEAAQKQRP